MKVVSTGEGACLAGPGAGGFLLCAAMLRNRFPESPPAFGVRSAQNPASPRSVPGQLHIMAVPRE